MCIVCLEFQKERMTRKEALRALGEMVTFPSPSSTEDEQDHFKLAMEKLSEEEAQEMIDLVSYYDLIRLEGEGG